MGKFFLEVLSVDLKKVFSGMAGFQLKICRVPDTGTNSITIIQIAYNL